MTVLFAIPTCAFIVSSTWQLADAVFKHNGSGGPSTWASTPADAKCLEGVRRLADGVMRARTRALEASHSLREDSSPTGFTFSAGLSPEWDDSAAIEQTCAVAPHARDAFAAVRRLRTTEEALAERDAIEVTAVWKDVQAYFQ